MAEKRKPYIVILLRKASNGEPKKKTKVELFDSELWGVRFGLRRGAKKYRIRVNGKWFDKTKGHQGRKYFSKWEFRDVFFRGLKL